MSENSPPTSTAEQIDRLDTRHDELLSRLEELDRQVEAALRDVSGGADVVA